MAFIKTTIFFLFMVAAMNPCMADNATYFVGEEKGWQRLGFNYYPNWAYGKNFHVGDILVFQYDPSEHDVVEVDEQAFDSCTAQAPFHEYHSGLDKIILENPGRYFFICSFGGHCAAGQKLGILVDYNPPNVPSGPPNSQSRNPFGPGNQNPVPLPYEISASSTLSSNLLIAITLSLAAVFAHRCFINTFFLPTC